MFDKIYRVLVLLLLVVLVGGVGAVGYFSYTDYNNHLARITKCNNSVKEADFAGMMADYQKDVYNTPSTDTIYKQILIANEYQILAISKQTMVLVDCIP
jgi:hypothetical protein